jgi:crotonobetainyl-CoA:carnitine CoA-transferase CaiB-like acyl-CoA transferase
MGACRPLSDIRVLDFGQYIAGPAAAMMLGDFGAEVIRIDPPGGPRWGSPAAAMLNRGKTCVELDLKTEAGLSEARRFIRSADVLIENFRPAVMERLGLGQVVVREDNPGLVYLSLPGFSSKDRDRARIPAWEAIIAAACGQYSDMGLNRVLMGIEPSFSPLPLASAYGAVLGAGAVTMALAKRATSGRGDSIEVPLAAALMEGLAYNSQRVEDYPNRYKSGREKEIERRRKTGASMDASYAELQELLDPFYRNYECADGRQVYVVSASHIAHPERVLKVLGLWDQLIADGLPRHDPYLDVSDWPDGADCTLANYPLSLPWAHRISLLMKQAFLTKPAFEWERIFGEASAPAAAQRTTQEWLASEHALQSGLIVRVDDPDYGEMRQLGNLAWLKSDAGAALEKTPRRKVEPAAVAAEPKPLTSTFPLAGGWLEGVTVLDLTNVIAGPTIASTLARFGADVISIDPVKPTMDPWNAIVFGMQAGRGKRSLLMNLKSDRMRAALDRLLKWADVVTVNATDKQLAGIGLDPAHLREAYPRLILCQLDSYGGPRRGPRSDFPGYDDLAQASTGVMARFGGSIDTPEEHAHFGTIDVLAGLCGVLAIGATLIRRARTGLGDVARASLCAAGQLIQAPFMYDYRGRGPFNEPSGREVKGWNPIYRAYKAKDGWFFFAARDSHLVDLSSLTGFESASGLSGEALEEELESIFASRPMTHWLTVLQAADLGAQRLNKMHDVCETNLVRESTGEPDLDAPTFAFVRHDRHPSGRWVDLVAPNAIRPSEATIRIPGPMPKPGAQSREILSDLGLATDEIEMMIADVLVAEEWCRKYLPE